MTTAEQTPSGRVFSNDLTPAQKIDWIQEDGAGYMHAARTYRRAEAETIVDKLLEKKQQERDSERSQRRRALGEKLVEPIRRVVSRTVFKR